MRSLTTYVSCSPSTASHLLRKLGRCALFSKLAKDKTNYRKVHVFSVPGSSEMTDVQF